MRIKILLLAIALLGFYQYSWASNAVVEHGIEPVMMENFESVDPPEETVEAKILKKEKTGFAKMFSWVKKKVNKTLSFFGIGDDPNSFSIIGFLLGFLLSIIGVILAYLLLDSPGIKGAWIGFLVGLLLYGIGFLTIF